VNTSVCTYVRTYEDDAHKKEENSLVALRVRRDCNRISRWLPYYTVTNGAVFSFSVRFLSDGRRGIAGAGMSAGAAAVRMANAAAANVAAEGVDRGGRCRVMLPAAVTAAAEEILPSHAPGKLIIITLAAQIVFVSAASSEHPRPNETKE